MKLKYLLKLSTRTFRVAFGRTLMTVLGTSIGIAAILVFVSLGYGVQKLLLEQITTSESLLSLDVNPPSEKIKLDQEKINAIRNFDKVEEVGLMASFMGQITLEKLTSNTSFYACQPSYLRLGGVRMQAGNYFANNDAKEIIVSTALLQSFGEDPTQILDKQANLTIFENTGEENENQVVHNEGAYKIVGVIEDTTSFAYLPLGSLADFNITNYDQAKVKVTQSDFIPAVTEQITNEGFLVSSLSETIDEANKIFSAVQIILAIFGLVALLVGAIGMANTMTVTLLERTNEIGIMKAIGGADRDIGMMFITESLIMGFLGGIGGIVIGFAATFLLNQGLNLLAQNLGGQAVNIFYTPSWFVMFIIIFSALVGLLTGIFPARKAAKLNSLEALRYK